MTISSRFRLASLAVTSVLLMGSLNTALAADTMSQRLQLRGTVTALSGDMLQIQSREGKPLTVALQKGWKVSGVAKAQLSDIKKGDYVGIASMPQSGGGDGALEVLIFPPQMKGANEGHFAWDLKPGSSMTNASVVNAVKSVDNSSVTVNYNHHEKKIAIPEGTPVVTLAPATTDDIKPGATVFIPAQKGEGDSLMANAVIVGKNGVVPPM